MASDISLSYKAIVYGSELPKYTILGFDASVIPAAILTRIPILNTLARSGCCCFCGKHAILFVLRVALEISTRYVAGKIEHLKEMKQINEMLLAFDDFETRDQRIAQISSLGTSLGFLNKKQLLSQITSYVSSLVTRINQKYVPQYL